MIKLRPALLLTLLFGSSAYAAEKADNAEAKKTKTLPAEKSVYGEIKETKTKNADGSEETLQKLLTVKGVDVQYKLCQDKYKDIAEIPKCIWEGDKSIPPLSEDIRKQVQAMYAQETAAKGRSPASGSSETSNLTNKSKKLGEDYMSDPAVVELSKVFQKKLNEAMLGDEEAQKDKKTIAAVDHSKFNDIYRTELGKTIVNAFTSYCLEADFENYGNVTAKKKCKDKKNEDIPCAVTILCEEKDKQTCINDNLKSLKGNLSLSTETKANDDADKWTRCISSVSNVCYADSDYDYSGASSASSAQLKYSKNKACIIMDYVKSARKNLLITEDQKKYYDSLGAGTSFQISNAKQVAVTEKNSIDTVTTVTSKEVEDSYQKSNDVLKKELEKCIDGTGKISDQEICKKFISMDTESKEKALTEFGIRQFALEDKIKEKFDDKGEVAKYLKEEGYSKEKIAAMTSNDPDIEKIKQEIRDRYTSERDAIISSMADKIKKQTTTKDGVLDTTTKPDQDKLKDIRDELSQRPENLKQLVHFNNVVSSYLEIDKGSAGKSRNVASLFAEIKGGAKNIKGLDDTEKQIKEIGKAANTAGLKSEKGETPTELGIDTLNGLFKYTNEK
ncbi:MAG: hypothetical protein WC635_14315 [Bacteriovorax sp.]|jgi:hypothetical protein